LVFNRADPARVAGIAALGLQLRRRDRHRTLAVGQPADGAGVGTFDEAAAGLVRPGLQARRSGVVDFNGLALGRAVQAQVFDREGARDLIPYTTLFRSLVFNRADPARVAGIAALGLQLRRRDRHRTLAVGQPADGAGV